MNDDYEKTPAKPAPDQFEGEDATYGECAPQKETKPEKAQHGNFSS